MVAPTLYTLAEMPRQDLLDGGLSRTALRADGSLVTFNWFQPGAAEPPPHHHPFDQLSLVITGELIFTVAGETIIAGPGTALRIPANVPHTARPSGHEVVLNIDIFAPAREDYLFLARHQDDYPRTDGSSTIGFGLE